MTSIGFYFHYIVRYQGLSTDLWSIYHHHLLRAAVWHREYRQIVWRIYAAMVKDFKFTQTMRVNLGFDFNLLAAPRLPQAVPALK